MGSVQYLDGFRLMLYTADAGLIKIILMNVTGDLQNTPMLHNETGLVSNRDKYLVLYSKKVYYIKEHAWVNCFL